MSRTYPGCVTRVELVHVASDDFGFLKYATCAAGCDAAANWHAVTVNPGTRGGWYPSLAVDASGRRHVSWYADIDGDLRYIQ